MAPHRLTTRWSMRVMALTALLAALLLFPASPVTAGGAPARFPLVATPFTYDPGVACTFPLTLTPIVNNEVITVFQPSPDGDVIQAINGRLVIQFSNADTGKSITLNVSGPGRTAIHPDGTATVESSGPTALFLFPGDTPSGPDVIIVSGRYVLNVLSPVGPAELQSLTGSHFDLCAALS